MAWCECGGGGGGGVGRGWCGSGRVQDADPESKQRLQLLARLQRVVPAALVATTIARATNVRRERQRSQGKEQMQLLKKKEPRHVSLQRASQRPPCLTYMAFHRWLRLVCCCSHRVTRLQPPFQFSASHSPGYEPSYHRTSHHRLY